jgi:Xaa-Pro aminopeptidase
MILRDTDVALVRETSWVKDIRLYRLMSDDIPALIADVAAEKGIKEGEVGIELQSYAVPYALGAAIARAIVPTIVSDATVPMGLPRLIKSANEIRHMRPAAAYARAGLSAGRRALRPGITEIALSAVIENALRVAGSDYWSIPVELASGTRTAGGHATARDRVIEPGDLVHLEFAGVSQRYHATAIHTFAAGEPSRRARDVYNLGRESLAGGIAAIRSGVPVAAVEEASLEPLRKAGLEQAATMRFGYGIGIAYPPIWLEPLQISRGSDQVLQPGMVFVLHAYLQLPEEHLGVILGGTYLLNANGLEMLVGSGNTPLEIV